MPCLLIVDDNAGDHDLIRNALSEVDATVQIFAVENAVQAFTFLDKQNGFTQMPTPDLVLIDINMPVIDGFHALKLIKETPTWAALPVIVWSTSGRTEDKEHAAKLGAVEYIVKPSEWNGMVVVAKALVARLKGAATEKQA